MLRHGADSECRGRAGSARVLGRDDDVAFRGPALDAWEGALRPNHEAAARARVLERAQVLGRCFAQRGEHRSASAAGLGDGPVLLERERGAVGVGLERRDPLGRAAAAAAEADGDGGKRAAGVGAGALLGRADGLHPAAGVADRLAVRGVGEAALAALAARVEPLRPADADLVGEGGRIQR